MADTAELVAKLGEMIEELKSIPDDGQWLVVPDRETANRLRRCLENNEPTDWLTIISLDYLSDFNGEWDFEKDGPLGAIEVTKQEVK